MRDILDQLMRWDQDDIPYATATVVRTLGSAPLGVGTTMAVSRAGQVVGSISGGCIEAAVIDLAIEAIATARSSQHSFGVSDDDAFNVGLTCGGTIEIVVTPSSPEFASVLTGLESALTTHTPIAIVTILDGPVDVDRKLLLHDGMLQASVGSEELDRSIATRVSEMLDAGESGLTHVTAGHNCTFAASCFVHTFPPPPRMVIFGAIDFARSLTQVGKLMGYHVTVCDARPTFATAARFPEADEVVVSWPHSYLSTLVPDHRAALCVLTHDEKFDIPLLMTALRLDVGYVGAMGSRATCASRERELRRLGLTNYELTRLHAPIGLDLGGRTPAETAISIAAEVIASREHRPGSPLCNGQAPIHDQPRHAEAIANPAPGDNSESRSRV